MQFKTVQTHLAKKAAKYLSKELHTRIDLEGIYIKPFKSLVLEGLYVQDLQKDTLLYAPKLTVDIGYFSLDERKITINTLQLDSSMFYLKDYKDKTTNLQFIINYFDTGTPSTQKKKKRKPYDINLEKIVLNNIGFRYKNFRVDTVINGINFDDILLKNLNGTFLHLDTRNHLAKFDVKHLSFYEKSGFYLKNLSTNATIDTNQMEFKKLLLQTADTRLTDYVKLSYKKFRDFGHFIRKVRVKANLKDTYLHPQDIAYFAPQVGQIKLDVRVEGSLSGYVNNIKARNFSVKAGQTTYLKGNFNIKGLPKISETFLDLDFDQIYTNKKDADFIVSALTSSKQAQVPEIVEKFGNVNFKGRFTGFPKDFIAYGEFKTRLGRLISDVNMKILKKPVYEGTIKAVDFNIGDLLNDANLGRTTLTAKIKGEGFDKKQLAEQLNSNITYLDYKGYRYNNIQVDGSFKRNLFAGKIKVNDANIKLDFDGNINLNPALPEFNFTAELRNAKLNVLNLTKDTLQVDADFKTNFTGNNLGNIQGNLALRQIKVTSPKTTFAIQTLQLSANGTGKNRSLTVNSDILDASINGEYDINTLPSYFLTVAKKYVPSLQAKTVKPSPQNFDFQLELKYFDPLSTLFFPHLKLPQGALMNGKFTSDQNSATFNAFAKLAEYKGVKVNNIIIDETTTDKALNIFISSDRVDITDSLYIKNVNIANVLKNDSLNLNIKLSDKNATNQLDLNGLVQFKRDSSALFSILPSDVIINRETWKIQEQVRIGFDAGKTTIKDFELSHNEQILTIDGIISQDPKEKLNVKFDKFNLQTFNPLTKGEGIDLKGELNGGIDIASVLKTPRIESNLSVSSLIMNNTSVGDLQLKADFDNETKLVNVVLDIQKEHLKTLNIAGTYNANAEENSLDMTVSMDNSELIIFEPFLKRLVSNLTGTVSADLKLTGKIFNPQIDGTLKLNNAGLIVNYLKTPYHINDEVTVQNSVILLDNLILKDIKNHEAIANGTVDMKNPNNPDIDVIITARNFMALNTRAKDNPLYYGTAYGTGTFSFKGPTDNMHINIDAKTEAGTIFNIPLNSSETVSENDFITFVSKDSSNVPPPKKQNTFKGLVMDFNLAVDRNTEVNIYTDIGKLTGKGESDALNLRITSLGDFEMKGDYLISEGQFEFTAQDFINKIFDIRHGGSIRWTGDPMHAQISLKAVYSVRTSVKPLYQAAGLPSDDDKRVQAEAIMNLNGDLLKPDISFDLNFPTDAYVKDELQGFLSDVNNKNQQALSLIVRRSFSPNTGLNLNLGAASSTLASAGTELLFNQFNNILAQSLNLNFVDLNIRSFNEASASFRFLNDRLVFTYGVTDRRAELYDYNFIGNSIARDVEALYLLKRDGSLVLRFSNRLNNRSFLDLSYNNEYVSAIGLVFRQEFDNANEFLRLLIGNKRREERRKQNPQNPSSPIATKPDEPEIKSKR
ncbi:translocation/assembly module TamB domain-containing protein [Rubrolithibacter danxiaensis]|uniref:translocation/assembly module TamB domain-containing protein n=1 Tax=Rubrolithibacter danxiaensis TaxID=3390805 RepID=UPI003BF8CF71